MIVYFLRHASAGSHMANPKKDEKRGLDQDGIQQCGYVGRALAALDVGVDVMISSPLKRAAQTASLVGNEMGFEGKLQIDSALRPESAFADFAKLLAKYSKSEAVMVVGHNPNLSEFAGRLIAEGGCEAGIDLKKGAVARIEVNRQGGTLTWCLTPKLVKTLQATPTDNVRPKSSRK